MKFKFRKRLKKTFAVCCAVLVVVCSMAFSVAADEVLFNGTLTYDENVSGYTFPSYIPLTVGDTYSLTYNGETFSAVVQAPMEDLPVPFLMFYNIGFLISGDAGFGNGFETGIIWQAGEPPATIDIILSKASGSDQSQDQVIFEQNVTFSNYGGSMLGTLENVSLSFIIGRDYEISVNGINRVYTAQLFDDGSGIYIGVAPEQDGDFLVGNLGNGLVINADHLVTAGTYPVKITLLGIKGPSFLGSVTDAIGSVLSWVGIPINEMLNDGGALVTLLPLFAIGISIAAIFVGIKLIRSFTWGN